MGGPRRFNFTLFLIGFLSICVALASVRYLVPGAPGAAPDILANAFTRYGLLAAHAGWALVALAIGTFQFVPSLRLRHPSLHRRIGTLYVLCCLAGGVAGLVLAFGSTAGPIATAGFALLAIAWIYTTAMAWRAIRARRIAEHQRWMVRSFALTLAAVTLRIYLPLSMFVPLEFMVSYRAISFLCWVPNLVIAEWLIRQGVYPRKA